MGRFAGLDALQAELEGPLLLLPQPLELAGHRRRVALRMTWTA